MVKIIPFKRARVVGAVMIATEDDIEMLIGCEKIIKEAPKKAMKEEHRHHRNDMKLVSEDGLHHFDVFLRKSREFTEDFSVGLIYNSPDGKKITLVRFNGQHHQSDDPLNLFHHFNFHIHKATILNIESGRYDKHPACTTDRYASFEEAVIAFCEIVNIKDFRTHFEFARMPPLFQWGGLP